jgi:hypothetical protein
MGPPTALTAAGGAAKKKFAPLNTFADAPDRAAGGSAGRRPRPVPPGLRRKRPGTDEPASAPTKFLRVSVNSFSGATKGSLAEVAFAAGAVRLAPQSASIPDNAGTGEANAFDGNPAT